MQCQGRRVESGEESGGSLSRLLWQIRLGWCRLERLPNDRSQLDAICSKCTQEIVAPARSAPFSQCVHSHRRQSDERRRLEGLSNWASAGAARLGVKERWSKREGFTYSIGMVNRSEIFGRFGHVK